MVMRPKKKKTMKRHLKTQKHNLSNMHSHFQKYQTKIYMKRLSLDQKTISFYTKPIVLFSLANYYYKIETDFGVTFRD